MTPEKQRIAIAEAVGYRAWQRERNIYPFNKEYEWSRSHPDNQRINGWELTERKDLCSVDSLPRYLSDLNAMHEAEKVLSQGQKTRYVFHLQTICGGQQFGDNYFATAAQRAEAFLRTLGLWEDTPTPTPMRRSEIVV